MRDEIIQSKLFSQINLSDPFFDSLRNSYPGFDEWFLRKANESAYVVISDRGEIQAFLYLKVENGTIKDIDPPLNTSTCLKVGTFKINAKGTRLGERFVKKIFDHAIVNNIKYVYVTVFEEHEILISILKRYGFFDYGTKTSLGGVEKVFLKDFNKVSGNTLVDYPVIDSRATSKWLLAIYPEWHTRLFPDSILRTEDTSIIKDISHTNSIHKIYIAWMKDMNQIKGGDTIVIYRTKEEGKSAEYSAVATSLCVVEDINPGTSFTSESDFTNYCKNYSVFTEDELKTFFKSKRSQLYAIKMTYNIALPKRPTRNRLIEEVGLPRDGYWGLMKLTKQNFNDIITIGGVYGGLVID